MKRKRASSDVETAVGRIDVTPCSRWASEALVMASSSSSRKSYPPPPWEWSSMIPGARYRLWISRRSSPLIYPSDTSAIEVPSILTEPSMTLSLSMIFAFSRIIKVSLSFILSLKIKIRTRKTDNDKLRWIILRSFPQVPSNALSSPQALLSYHCIASSSQLSFRIHQWLQRRRMLRGLR